MKKYFLKESKQEIAVGQTIELCTPVTTSYGRGVVTTEVEVTESVLKKLISDGFVVVEEDSEEKSISQAITKLRPYIKELAKRYGITFNSAYVLLGMVSGCPLTHLTMLIEIMADSMNKGKAFEGYCFVLNPIHDFSPRWVKRQKPVPGSFYSEEDAKTAYSILKPFIAKLSGK